MAKKLRLGDLLVNENKITENQVLDALSKQREPEFKGKKLGEVLISLGMITEKEILMVLEQQMGVPYLDLDVYKIDPKIPKMISESMAREHTIIPVSMEEGKLLICTSDPLDVFSIDNVKLMTGFDAKVAISEKSSILRVIDQFYDGQEAVEKAIEDFNEENDIVTDLDEVIEDEDVTNAPMVRLVNTILSQAVKLKVSDIHIEAFEKEVRIRYRLDGELVESMTLTKATHAALITRIKIIGGMDISERRKPQDGRIETKIAGRSIDMRISILPTVYGEKVVIRLLDRDSIIVTKKDLGFTDHSLNLFDKLIKIPEGMILVTGPTGSGKTTTLFTVLRELNKVSQNIITVEDPVEYRLHGVNQVQVNVKAGLSFAQSLRSILRQDPDIVMVGEIRDSETAEIATRAAITGHVVLSTLHTNDATSTVSRLIDMGVERYMVSSAVVGVIAQRLVRKVCPKCKVATESTKEEMEILGVDTPIMLQKGTGCNFCSRTGYTGRTAIHEILILDRELKMMLNKGESINAIKDKAIEKGMKTLNATCKELVANGTTTVEELLRVAYSID